MDTASTAIRHLNLYAYGYFKPVNTVTFTAGVSGDFLSGDSIEISGKNQVNPKFGVMWNPAPATTVRAAAFRVLKRTLVTDQTLEPTQVAGFEQFFDQVDGSSYWRYGVGIDQKLRDLLVGAEYSQRKIEVP